MAHPDDESFGLGAVLAAFAAAGARVSVLCFTHGEASTLHGVDGELRSVRAMELEAAAAALGVSHTTLLDYPDGDLPAVPRAMLAAHVVDALRRNASDGLVAFDPSGVTGHPDHTAATEAALAAAVAVGLPALGWTLPAPVAQAINVERGTAFTGHHPADVDLVVPVERARQLTAAGAHASQALPTSVLWRRLELLGGAEHLRRLVRLDGGE